jgi:cyanophycin synthetase
MPGLEEHRCSIGERGGFITRLERGTYAAHIIEHVALELQTMIGHEVGFGRTRGGEVDGEYTIVFEHLHEAVGLRAAGLALEIVQQAFAGSLGSVDYATSELAALAKTPDVPRLTQRVACGITGGSGRAETRDEIVRRGFGNGELIVDISPAYLLQAGLPYWRSDIAVVLDTALTDVPARYREEERAQRLVATVADAVDRGGIVIVPAKEWEVQDLVRDAGCRVAIFAPDTDITRRDKKVARAAAYSGRRKDHHRDSQRNCRRRSITSGRATGQSGRGSARRIYAQRAASAPRGCSYGDRLALANWSGTAESSAPARGRR